MYSDYKLRKICNIVLYVHTIYVLLKIQPNMFIMTSTEHLKCKVLFDYLQYVPTIINLLNRYYIMVFNNGLFVNTNNYKYYTDIGKYLMIHSLQTRTID